MRRSLSLTACLTVLALFFLGQRHTLSVASAQATPITLVYTTDTNGFLQNCGCATAQVGGLAKRATLLKQLEKDHDSVLFIDGGNLASDLRRSEAVMECLKLMRCQAVGLGELEVKLGADFLDLARSHALPLIACPLPEGVSEGVSPYVLSSIIQGNVGVVSVSKASLEELLPLVKRTLIELHRRAKLIVVLSQLGFDQEKQLVRAEGIADVVDLMIGMRGVPVRQRTEINGVTFVPITQKGEVGVVEVSFDGDAKPKFAHHFEVVTDNLPADNEVQEIVAANYMKEAEQLLKASLPPEMDRTELNYESADHCVDCHPTEVRLWRASKHAHAVETLSKKDRLVGECLICHSEFYRRTDKFNPNFHVALHGVECTACHGDGILHAALRRKEFIMNTVEEKLCRTCHTPVTDPKFNYQAYLKKIRHW